MIILTLWLWWRVAKHGKYGKKLLTTQPEINFAANTLIVPVMQLLTAKYGAKKSGETLRNWLQRLHNDNQLALASLIPVVDLYYKQRFDPLGLSPQDLHVLEASLTDWLRNQKLS
ncbi:hypothetical protein TI04_12805 [Achromatium sp. WMS2]|nr:hypothetical protein TI04_12805 [Achromatium sp. WMS2]